VTPVERYLGRLRRRAAVQQGARALVFASASAALTLTVAARLVGPVASWVGAVVAWSCVAVAALGAAGLALRGLSRLAGSGAARLLASHEESLASAARSAAEFAHDDAQAPSPALVAAHALRVEAALAVVPPNTVLPWRALRSRALAGAGVALGGCAFVWALDPTTVAGAWALAHPGAPHGSAMAVAAIVERCDARLVFPAYLGRAAEQRENVVDLEAPLGTTVEWTVRTRVPARSGSIDVAGRATRLVRGRDGVLTGRFVVHASGPLYLNVRTPERELRDARARTVRAIRDEAPRVSLTEPAEDLTVEPNAEVPVAWAAKDDGAIREAELVLVDAEGREIRRRLGTYVGDARKPGVSGTATVRVEALGAQPGDRIVMRVEASDCDDVSGPNVGRSAERTITIAGDATRREQTHAALRAALDAVLDVLAARLEQPLPEEFVAARTRFDALSPGCEEAGNAVDAAASAMREDGVSERDDVVALQALAADVRDIGLNYVEWFYEPRSSSLPRRVEAEAEIVALLERGALMIEDMLARGRLEDAVAVAQELNRLRQRMTSLLSELRRRPDEATRRALLAEIARAEARMRELGAQLAQMSADVPGEFANVEAMQVPEAESALAALRDAVERNDLDAAMRQLAALERELAQMSGAIDQGADDFENARSSGEAQALADAVEGVKRALAQQRQLALETARVRSRAAARAAETLAAVPPDVARSRLTEARQVQHQLAGLDRNALDEDGRTELDAAQAALHDLEDALRAGQLASANELAAQAVMAAQRLESRLQLESQMRGARDRGAASRASLATDAQKRTYGLWRALDDLVPELVEHVDDADRADMARDEPAQSQLSLDTEALAQRFAVGPNGAPLSAEAAEAVHRAAGAMEDASEALDVGNPQQAAERQDRAISYLEEMLKNAEQQRSRRSRGGRGSRGSASGEAQGGEERNGRDGRDGDPSQDVVRIPDGSDFVGPAERRRRVLDAMRDDAPGGFEDAVRRYYEDILR
jgi:hypothetical protein